MSTVSRQSIEIERSLLEAVEKKARHEGRTAQEYVRRLIERDLLADKAFDEILKPVREDFRKSGITPEQLDEVVERARDATRRKRRGARR